MRCKNCGAFVSKNSTFCHNCGIRLKLSKTSFARAKKDLGKPLSRKNKRDLAAYFREIQQAFVFVHEPEWLHRNGAVAKAPTLLRHLPTRAYNIARKAIDDAMAIEDEDERYNMLLELAADYDVPLKEIYTLFMSP